MAQAQNTVSINLGLINTYMQVRELLDPKSAFTLTWDNTFAPQERHAEAYDHEGRSINISFVQVRNNITEIEFMRGGSHDVTNRGSELQVFSTVLRAIEEYLSGYQPGAIIFSAKEPSRYSLYKKLASRFAPKYGYKQVDISKYSDKAQQGVRNSGTNVIVLKKQQAAPNTHKHEVEHDGKLMELTFYGSQCTKDCSGHRAGYRWSKARGGVANPVSYSQSFINGSNIAARHVQNAQKRTRKKPVVQQPQQQQLPPTAVK